MAITIIKKTKKRLLEQAKKAYKKVFGRELKDVELEISPNPKFGDFTIKCFALGKEPEKIAKKLANEIPTAEPVGPYLNFRIDEQKFSQEVLKEILKQKGKYGQAKIGRSKKIMLEFAHPNTHKEFHIGHLKNIITAASLIKLLENVGYKIIKANYQGDIGLHIAKCLYGISKLDKDIGSVVKQIKTKGLDDKIKFLGKAYAVGAKTYQENEKAKQEIHEINKKIYQQDKSVKQLYQETRQWSLDYFDGIYKRFNITFDRLYFESEVFERGKQIVLEHPDIFKKSKGAIIFEGEKYGLHNRVFVNSEGFATYEAKDLALAELQFKEYKPDKIIHLVGPEQIAYFKVLFKALEKVMPKSKNKEMHLWYGWVQLKKGKMSSRTGQIIPGLWLLEQIKKRLRGQEKVAQAALRYSMLKNERVLTMTFDIDESISFSGNSGPYLQYTYARIKSILRKAAASGHRVSIRYAMPKEKINQQEKNLILKLSLFPEITTKAADEFEPSIVAKYLFDLAQIFNNYYQAVPILKSEKQKRQFRLSLIKAVCLVLKKGLDLLGIETLEKM